MKPTLIGQEIVGRHNQNLEATRGRLLRGGSWKKQRIVMIVPAGDSIPARVYLSHMCMIFPPNQSAYRMLAQGMEVGEAYTNAIEQILGHPELSKWEYVLTVEHDNIPPQDGIIKLVEDLENHKEFACVGGLYFTKGEGGVAQIWGDIKDPLPNFRPQVPQLEGLQECWGTGMGFNLWRMKMFTDARLRKPWFRTVAGKEGAGTQDLYFWGDARKYGHRCAVDCSVRVGHYDSNTDIVW